MINARHQRVSTLNPTHPDLCDSNATSSLSTTTTALSARLRQPTVVYASSSPTPASRASSWSPDRLFWGPAASDDRLQDGGKRAVWWSDGALADKDTLEKAAADPGELWARYTQTLPPRYTFEEPGARRKRRSGGRRSGPADDGECRYTMKLSLPCPRGCCICVYSRQLGPVKVYFSNTKSHKKSSSPSRQAARKPTRGVRQGAEPQLPLRPANGHTRLAAGCDKNPAKNLKSSNVLPAERHTQHKTRFCRHSHASCDLCSHPLDAGSNGKGVAKTPARAGLLSTDPTPHCQGVRSTSPTVQFGKLLLDTIRPSAGVASHNADSLTPRLSRKHSLSAAEQLSASTKLLARRESRDPLRHPLPDCLKATQARRRAKMAATQPDKNLSVTVS